MSRRREVLRALFGAPFAAKLIGCDDAPTTREVRGDLLGPDMARGHQLRSGIDLNAWAALPEERVDVAIVGGGPAGLSAGWRLKQRGVSATVIELEPEVGGTARAGESQVTRYPWGAHYIPVPPPENATLRVLLEEMGALRDGEPAEEVLIREPDERVYFRGFWYPGLYPYANASGLDLEQLARFEHILQTHASMRDAEGRRAFAIPVSTSSRDADLLALDRLDAETWLADQGLDSARLSWMCDYACRDDYGLRLADTSAWALLFYWVSRMPPAGGEPAPLLTWPEGNGAIVSHLSRALRGHLRTGEMVVDVQEDEDGVSLSLLGRDDARSRLRAGRVILALPRFISDRIGVGESSASDSMAQPDTYAPWMVANLHLDARPTGRGAPPAWDNVLYDSPSLGYVSATHQRGRDVGETVWTYYLPLCAADPRQARHTLQDTTHAEWTDAITRDLRRAHPDLDAHLHRIDVWRWGHGMVQPRVGFLRGGARFDAGAPRGRLHFAHSDLSGIALFEEAFHHGVRAADEVADALA